MEDFCTSWLFGLFALGLQLPELKHQDFKALKKTKQGEVLEISIETTDVNKMKLHALTTRLQTDTQTGEERS